MYIHTSFPTRARRGLLALGDMDWGIAIQLGYKMASGRRVPDSRQLCWVSRRVTTDRRSNECVRNKLDSKTSPEATAQRVVLLRPQL